MNHPLPKTPGPAPIASMGTLAIGLGTALVLSVPGGLAIAAAAGWSAEDGRMTPAASTLAGVICVAIGAALGSLLLLSRASRTPQAIGLRVVASSSTRMMVAMAACTTLVIAARPHPYAFFASLGLAFVLCLIVETVWASHALRGTHRPTGSSTAPAGAPA